MKSPVVTVIVAELFGSSLWFSANGAAADLQRHWGMTTADLGHLTSAVQFGFIAGTLLFALSGLADRFSASRIFTICAVAGALTNAAFAFISDGLDSALLYRFLTGVTLAGIYPVGMKLIVSWEPEKKGQALGWLVGMLTLGTALPHFIESVGTALSWEWVVTSTSLLALAAAVLIYLMGDGPHHTKVSRMHWGRVFGVFGIRQFRNAVFGYFGHMWELYAFWTITPFLVAGVFDADLGSAAQAESLWSFSVIGIGALGCILGGMYSVKAGSANVALLALAGSALMCLVFPLVGDWNPVTGLGLLLFWGFCVVADSPQFSALAASHCPAESVGSALAIMNSIGFLITIISIELITTQWSIWHQYVALALLPGPLFGLYYMVRFKRNESRMLNT